MKRLACLLPALAAAVFFAPATKAATIFNLNTSNGCCGSGPYGTVQLTQNGPNEVDFLVSLLSGFQFVWTGQAGAFGFNLAALGTPTVTVSPASIAAGFSGTVLGSTASQSEHMDGYGLFNYAITGDANHTNGASQPIGQTLAFAVTDSLGLSVSNFLYTSTGGIPSYFTADIYCMACSSSVNTGFVGTNGDPVTGTPEPSTLLICGLGLAGIGLLRKRSASGLATSPKP